MQYTDEDFFIPAFSFIKYVKILKIIDNLTIDSMGKNIVVSQPTFNVINYSLQKKGNGYSIDIQTTETFNDNLLAYS